MTLRRPAGAVPRRTAGWVLWLALAGSVGASAGAAPAEGGGDEPAAGGTLIWVFADELDLVGDMRAYLPYPLRERGSLYFAVDARTTIERAAARLTFLVQDLDYRVELGYRAAELGPGGGPLRFSLGQRGTERVDDPGQPFVRYAGIEAASPSRDDFASWHLQLGAVVEEREVRADAIVRGGTRLAWSVFDPRLSLGIDAHVDGLVDGGSLRADWQAGPHLSFGRSGRRLTVFLHYQDSENPLGLGTRGLLLGLDYSDEIGSIRGALAPPDVGGSLALGAGEGRKSGRLRLRLLSPPWAGKTRAVAEIDGNILTAQDTGELYYLYHVGLEGERAHALLGAYFYHRSNHVLAEPNDRVTILNVIEAGAETRGWDVPGGGGRRVGARLRVGYLLDSSFGERRSWHARGGVRLALRRGARRWNPFVIAEGETGDVDRRRYAVGLVTSPGLELTVEYREDDQFFGRDKDAVLIATHVGF